MIDLASENLAKECLGGLSFFDWRADFKVDE